MHPCELDESESVVNDEKFYDSLMDLSDKRFFKSYFIRSHNYATSNENASLFRSKKCIKCDAIESNFKELVENFKTLYPDYSETFVNTFTKMNEMDEAFEPDIRLDDEYETECQIQVVDANDPEKDKDIKLSVVFRM